MGEPCGLKLQGITKVYRNAAGQKRVTCGPRLKETQTYTRQFGNAVADLKKWNKGTIKNSKVTKGQKLKIYPNRA
jgi:hypothetical protein